MLRIVLDTNVVLDLFHWANVDAVPIMAALEAGRIECLADARTLDELQRVLTYPQLKLTPEMIAERWARYSALVRVSMKARRPRCRAARTATTRSSSNWLPAQRRHPGQQGQGAYSSCVGERNSAFQIVKPAAMLPLLAG
jgi:predicted nucleic acid-binding protein